MNKSTAQVKTKNLRAPHAPAYLSCNHNTLHKAARNLGQLYDDAIGAAQLRSGQFGVLVHIAEMDEPTMKELARELVLDLSALSRTVQPMIRDGYVRLVANPEDGRSKCVVLSKAGERKIAEAYQLWLDVQARFEAVVGAERARTLRDTMIMLSTDEFRQAVKASGRSRPPKTNARLP